MSTDHSSHEIASRIDYTSQQAITANRIVGSVIIVAKQGEIFYQQAFGYANREQKIAMDLDALFLLSSVTKPMVIATALCLIAKGQLDINAPLTDYLPHFQPKLANGQTAVISIHQLLNHTAGLSYRFAEPNGLGPYNSLQISDGFDDIFISLPENLSRLAKAPLIYEPGKSWAYSLSIDVLGAVIESVTHQALRDVIRTYITAPLSMQDTDFAVTDTKRLVTHYHDNKPKPEKMPNHYQMHIKNWNDSIISYAPTRIFNPQAYHSGGAGMVGSAPDFMRFLLAISSKNTPLSKDKLMDKMAQCYVSSKQQTQGPGWGFGYGGAVLDDPILANSPQGKGTISWGGVYGHTWWYDPVNDLATVIFTNTAIEGMSGRYPTQIVEAIYQQ